MKAVLFMLVLSVLPLIARAAAKRIEIDKTNQVLRAFDGNQLVQETPISTGKQGKATPNGDFQTGAKYRMHRSRLYQNAPMPYSIQVAGNYFIHGFKSVPEHPASHGCIRMPVEEAEKLYNWVEPGTPVHITGRWPGFQTTEAKEVRQETAAKE